MGNVIEKFIRKKKSFQKIRVKAYMHNATRNTHGASQHTILTYTPMTLILSLRRMFPKNGVRDDKLCLLQNNSLLLPRFSYRVRLTPQKKRKGGGNN